MRVFIYIDVKKINIKAMNYRAWGMCVTSNVLVMFSSFEIFDVISYKVVFIVYLIDFICILSFNEVIV
ncbi:hypothetical protein ECTW10119_0754 [Escherichia coli TW10119]|nr:hypothetical protein ECTW10119_0754 [Escherichia coli TW10119]